MKVGDKVVVIKKIELGNGKVYPVGATGIIKRLPRSVSSVHVQMDDVEQRVILTCRRKIKVV